MKNLYFFLFVLLVSGTSIAQTSASATADTFAEIVEPITITKTQNLNFGRIIGTTLGGTVTIENTAAGERVIDPDMNAPGEVPSSAHFTVTASDYSYGITMVASDLTAADQMNMVFNPVNNLGVSGSGDNIIYVGGDLIVNENQGAGTYTGTVQVTVTYD